MVNGTSLAVEDSSFTNNTALTGGGIFMSRVQDTYVYNSNFYYNNVSQAGGGINSGTHVLVLTCTVLHDTCNNRDCGTAPHCLAQLVIFALFAVHERSESLSSWWARMQRE